MLPIVLSLHVAQQRAQEMEIELRGCFSARYERTKDCIGVVLRVRRLSTVFKLQDFVGLLIDLLIKLMSLSEREIDIGRVFTCAHS